MVLNVVFRMTFRCFRLKYIYIQNYFLTEIQVRKADNVCLQQIFPNFSSIQMSEEQLTDYWATSIIHCTRKLLVNVYNHGM
jgi:hypothetical protein